jgi:hypothetical protein
VVRRLGWFTWCSFYAAIEGQIHHYIAFVHSILSVLSESATALLSKSHPARSS